MKKYLHILVLIAISNISSFSQNKILDGIYVSRVEGMVYKFKNDTFSHSYGDYIDADCGVIGETVKGKYLIENNQIKFSPLSPRHFQKSLVQYKKENYWDQRFDFEFSVTNLLNDSLIDEFTIDLYDSINFFPFMMINGFNGKAKISYSGIQKIKRIELRSGCYERLRLDFDSLFGGRHIYSIKLASMTENFVEAKPFSFKLIDINPKYIKIYFGNKPIFLVKEEYVTDEFIKTGVFIGK